MSLPNPTGPHLSSLRRSKIGVRAAAGWRAPGWSVGARLSRGSLLPPWSPPPPSLQPPSLQPPRTQSSCSILLGDARQPSPQSRARLPFPSQISCPSHLHTQGVLPFRLCPLWKISCPFLLPPGRGREASSGSAFATFSGSSLITVPITAPPAQSCPSAPPHPGSPPIHFLSSATLLPPPTASP